LDMPDEVEEPWKELAVPGEQGGQLCGIDRSVSALHVPQFCFGWSQIIGPRATYRRATAAPNRHPPLEANSVRHGLARFADFEESRGARGPPSGQHRWRWSGHRPR